MAKGNIRHMFPGGNTSKGFYSFYSYILDQGSAARIFIIKGGPGVGKSTFMKNIGNKISDMGFDVEFMHCSSDPDSLDGVVIPDAKVGLLDGTAPHVVDPKNPGAVDEIIYLGDFWDEGGIRENKEVIMHENMKISKLFERAYKYLKAAACIYDDMITIYDMALDNAKANAKAHSIVKKLFGHRVLTEKEGTQRKLFASAITPAGLKHYLESILGDYRVYVLESCPGICTSSMLNMINNSALERGYNTECYYCALYPEKLEHVVIPEAGVSFTTSNRYHNAQVEAYERICFMDFIRDDVLKGNSDPLEYDIRKFEELLDKAVATICLAKLSHDKMEKYYIPNMDFEAVQACCESTLCRVLEYVKN